MGKYIIDVGDAYIRHGLERTLTIPVRINEHEDHWMDTRIPVTLYTEPDIEKVREEAYEKGKMDIYIEDIKTINALKKEVDEAYQRGYETAKHKCNIQAEKDLREVGERHYQKGLSDAWEAARKLVLDSNHGGLTNYDIEEIFGVDEEQAIINYSASEAIEKIRQYEQKKEEIQVGDEVILDDRKYVVLVVDEDGIPEKLLEPDGYTLTLTTDVKLPKTGRHYPQIAEILQKMKEES